MPDISNIIEQIEKADEKQLHIIPATRLIEKLSLLGNRIESSKKRWFWELLQNASDYNKDVNIRLEVSEDDVTFRHDGEPFSVLDVLNLISPNSNKQYDQKHTDNIGKFGSGLVSTHILSSILEIKGLFLDEDSNCFSFSLSLDRSCYINRPTLIEQIKHAKEQFKTTSKKSDLLSGFNTSFSYKLGAALPGLPVLQAADVDVAYLYDALPYTLCFMPKVKSVIIEDKRRKAECGLYKIERIATSEKEISFSITENSSNSIQKYLYFEYNNASSVIRIENGKVVAFPIGLSRLFCNLPLIGTEDAGIPFLLNSTKFEPTTEREGVELEPDSNESNRNVFKDSAVLYDKIISYIADNKIRDAFHLTNLRSRFNGTPITKQQFKTLFLDKYKQVVLNHSIVCGRNENFISFSDVKFPFRDSKPDDGLYDICELFDDIHIPIKEDYKRWFDAIDFTLFPKQKLVYEDLAKYIENKGSVYNFYKGTSEVLSDLYDCAKYFVECDRFIFAKYRLLPDQSSNLNYSTNLYADINLPVELKSIYNLLYDNKKIEDKLLDQKFNQLNLLSQEFSIEMLAKDIDRALSNKYAESHENTAAISSLLNKLYNWISNSNLPEDKLLSYFQWYYPKRAALIVDMLTEKQREQALVIAKSGKLEVLSDLASSNLTPEQLRFVVSNIDRLPDVLKILSNKVDDEVHANPDNGAEGERIVYKELLRKYLTKDGYRVIWSSKDGEPCFDFKIIKDDKPFCYYDAKTTIRGIANSDSIPFFMRKSQWDFLRELDDSIPYVIARVFLGDENKVKYIRIRSEE